MRSGFDLHTNCLLCNIYRDKGYYIEWDEDLPFVVADTIGTTEGAVEEVVKKAVQVGFFDKSLFDQYRILTSNGIQNRFKSAVSRREGFEYIPEYLVSVCNNPIQSNFCIQKPSSTEFLHAETQPNRVSACKSTQSKVKERISPPPHAREGDISGIRLFSDKSLTECYGELKANIPWMEQFCMNIRLDYPDFTPELFYGFLDRFFRKLQNEGEIVKSPKDAMSHFANWLNIELEKLKKDGSRTSKNHPACGSEPVSVAEILCPKEGADASPDLVKNWIDGLSIGG
ncbi:DUF4373 domain-containing protein [Bacteroides fragilis]